MTAIQSETGMQMLAMTNQGGNSQMENKAKAMGVPADVIAQGQNAIKAWAKENGMIPGATKDDAKGDENKMNNSASDTLQEQLEASGITYDSYIQAIEEGPEATEALLKENDFSFDVKV